MIADLIEYNKHRSEIRLITKNVMSVYSIKQIYTDNLIHKLKHADYLVDNRIRKSSDIISYNDKKYNMYENVYRHIISDANYSLSRFAEYLNYFNLNHILWLHFYQIPSDDLHLVEILMTLSSNKPIIILDYIDKLSYKNKLYSLLFHIGLLDKLIIVPYTDIQDAISNSTCQTYAESNDDYKTLSRFPNEFIKQKFSTRCNYYRTERPSVYIPKLDTIYPASYRYTLVQLLKIYLYPIKYIIMLCFNWLQSYK